jgi:malonyl-CoA/methylmalonyl-CoA synthetase
MLLYTSGTTGKPKGVLSTHAILAAQIRSVVEAWEWNAGDRVLHVLPLHHLHGILNLLCAALWSGASCEFLARFDAERVWQRIADSHELTLFMAVPTIYAKLAHGWEQAPAEERARRSAGCRRLRLMVSGSAALPASVLERWRAISGHTLLERYGMTEFGMGLGNPLHGERRPGHVGVPFPGVDVRLVDDRGEPLADAEPGEIQVRGPGVFAGYFGKPEATRAAFTADGWFRTGDVAVREHGMYRILGRESVDILKSGGFKISALDVEEVLREHPAVRECAVVGVPDETWGQRIAAAVVVHDGAALSIDELRAFGKQRLAAYKVPSLLRVVTELPRNAMGKVIKSELVRWFA